jgi:hypothetical protein
MTTAPISAPSPIVTPPSITASLPIDALRLTLVGDVGKGQDDPLRRSFLLASRLVVRGQITSSSISRKR